MPHATKHLVRRFDFIVEVRERLRLTMAMRATSTKQIASSAKHVGLTAAFRDSAGVVATSTAT